MRNARTWGKRANTGVTQDAENEDWLGSNPLFTQFTNIIRTHKPIFKIGLV